MFQITILISIDTPRANHLRRLLAVLSSSRSSLALALLGALPAAKGEMGKFREPSVAAKLGGA